MTTRLFGALLLIGFLPGTPVPLVAQESGVIRGQVTALDSGQPLAGVSVSVVGAERGALTTEDGRYQIRDVPAGEHVLRAEILGYAPREITFTLAPAANLVLDVQLQPRAIELDEIVAVGYGTQRKAEITSAVSSIGEEAFVPGPALDAGSLVAGKLPGLVVSTTSGDPRDETELYLRGITTIEGSASPLVLVDGVPGTLETVAPGDIEEITVLKDGSAAAIYGSRAQNGVVLITTKKHTGGDVTIRYDGFLTQQRIYERPDFLDASDYRRLIDDGVAYEDLGYNTDWMDLMLRSPISHTQNVTIMGGGASTNYTGSLSYEDSEGVFIRSDNTEMTGRINLRHSMYDDRLQVEANLVNRKQTFFTGPDFESAWRFALTRNPTDRPYDDNGNYQERAAFDYLNPLALVNEENGEYEERTTRLHGTVRFRPVQPLNLSLLVGTSSNSEHSGSATTFRHPATVQQGRNGTADVGTETREEAILELTGSYVAQLGSHGFDLLGGFTRQETEREGFSAGNEDFPTDLFGYHRLQTGVGLGEGRADMGSFKDAWELLGYFGRLNYDWDNRLLVMLSGRYEADSRFGAGQKWGFFPGISAGWQLSQESFVRDNAPWIDDLRLRAGYGVTGVAPSQPYLSLTSYSYSGGFPYGGGWIQGLGPSRNPNPDLKWEEKHEVNLGLSFALFDSRLGGTVDVYRRETRDLLYEYSVPVPPNLTSTTLANVGTMENEGIEVELTYDVVNSPDVRWTTSANWSTTRNTLVNLSDEAYTTSDFFTAGGTGAPIQTYTHRVDVGGPIGNFYGWHSVDVDENGEWIVLNADGEEIPVREAGEADKRVIGNGVPDHFLAWNNTAQLGRFDASLNMRGAFGFQNLNFLRMYYENPTITLYNLLETAFEPVYGKEMLNYEQAYVSYYVEDGDYWKIDNATLGYSVPASLLSRVAGVVRNARIYVTGRNLYTFTGYKGLDPEVPFANNPFTAGNDNREWYPTTRSFSVGMSLTF